MAFNPTPFNKATVASSTIACTSESASVALGAQANCVWLANVGAKACYVKFGNSSVTATPPTGTAPTTESVGDMCLPAGFVGVLGTNGQSYIAAICISAETTTLRITPGEGFL